ncbi:hypothetical protein EVG20_g9966, partial [Dentipellis fragilis]
MLYRQRLPSSSSLYTLLASLRTSNTSISLTSSTRTDTDRGSDGNGGSGGIDDTDGCGIDGGALPPRPRTLPIPLAQPLHTPLTTHASTSATRWNPYTMNCS